MKPLKDKTVAKTPGRGPGKKGVLPRYVVVGNYRAKAFETLDVCDLIPQRHRGRVLLDFDADGELIGVEVIG